MAYPQRRISPDVELRAVKEELDLARKKIDRYTHLVTTLYDELDTLRNSICNKCKETIIPAWSNSSSPSPTPLWRCPTQRQTTNHDNPQTEAISNLRNAGTSSVISATKRVPFEQTSASMQSQTSAAVHNIASSPTSKDWSVVPNQEVRQTLNIHLAHTLKMKSLVFRVKFGREGKYLAVALYTGETYIYDMKTLSKRALVEHPAKEGYSVLAMQFSPDDKYIALGGSDSRIKIWNIAERRILAMFKGYKYPVFFVDFSADGRFLVSGSFDNSVRIWCMRDGSSKKLLDTEMTLVTSVAISPNGHYIAAANDDGMLRIWDFRSGQLLERWKAQGHPECLRDVVFTSDGKGLLSGGQDEALRSWDIRSLTANPSAPRRGAVYGGSIDEEKKNLTFQRHTHSTYAISTLPDSRWVLSGSGDPAVRIWDARTGALQCTLNGHQEAVMSIDASPDGHHLATGANDSLVRIWRYGIG